MSYTYASFVTALANELAVSAADPQFVEILPTLIDDSEQRCYRELDLLTVNVVLTSNLTANNRYYTIPTTSGHVLAIDSINVLDASNIRHPVTPTTREVIDFLWPSDTAPSAASIPTLFTRSDDTRVMFGPAPGSTWSCETIANIRPTPLSVANTTTYLSQYLPDLFLAGAMVSASGWMRNFGAQGDDPRMAVSWEDQFQKKLASARVEELKKQYISVMST